MRNAFPFFWIIITMHTNKSISAFDQGSTIFSFCPRTRTWLPSIIGTSRADIIQLMKNGYRSAQWTKKQIRLCVSIDFDENFWPLQKPLIISNDAKPYSITLFLHKTFSVIKGTHNIKALDPLWDTIISQPVSEWL